MSLAQVIIEASAIQTERIGHQAISLTHFSDLLECKIAAGSVVEIGGALFEAAADEAGTGWSGIANSSQVHMKLTVTGATAAMSFTTAAPTYSTSKQGWYVGLDRYIGGLYKDSGGNYSGKWLYGGQQMGVGIVPIGTIVAWHKTFANVPALPSYFVECNGQVLADAQSPLDGQTIPNLNGLGHFLRGAAVSGAVQGDSTKLPNNPFSHTHKNPTKTGTGGIAISNQGNPGNPNTDIATGNAEGWGGGDAETRPVNTSMVWIMRIK